MSPASQRLSMGQWVRWSIVASWCVSSLAVAQQPAPPKSTPPKVAPKPAPKPPTAEELALQAERARIKSVDLARNKLHIKISALSRAGQVGDGDKGEVAQYFDHYIDILTSPGGVLEYPDARQKMRATIRIFGNAPDKSGLAHVNDVLLIKLQEAAWADKYLPHGRFNCMLALGELNEVEPTSGGSGPVKPMPQALKVLLEAVVQADMLPGVKVAALTGIQRHAKLGIVDKNKEREVVVELSKLVQQASPPPDNTADGHHWMRRQAIDVLTSLKQPGPGNEAVTALAAAVNDKNNPMWVRLDAVRALGPLKVPADAMGEEVTPIVGNLTLDLLKNETSHRALRLGFQNLLIGLRGQDPQSGVIASLAGEDRKRGAELSQKVNIYSQIVGGTPDLAVVATQIPIEAAALEIWLKGEEDPNAPAP